MAADASTVAPRARPRSRPQVHGPALLASAACAAAGLALAAHHPLSGAAAVALWLAVAAACWRWPAAWLAGLPAVLPLVGLMPWSGWMVVEELDLLVLAVAAGGYAAWPRLARPPARSGPRALVPVMLALFAVSVALGIQRGVADAGGWQFGWWHGYREPMNAVRLGKTFFAALLLWPLWRRAAASDPAGATRLLGGGLAGGLAVVGVLVLWERVAYPGLLNFSTDYRVVALFWEMHVGGAALDAFLALAMPFGVWRLATAHTRGEWALGAAATALGAHAALVTFSRIDYVALPVGVAVMAVLLAAQQRRHRAAPGAGGTGAAVVLVAGFAVAAAFTFGTSGYRGMLALLGTMAALLAVGGAARPLAGRERWLLPLLALVGSAAAWALAAWVPKGAYLAFALLCVAALGLLLRGRFLPGAAAGLALPAGAAAVAWHWGGTAALQAMAVPSLAFALGTAVLLARGRPAWPASGRWQATSVGVMGLCAAVVGVFGGGAYMGDRVGAAASDAQSRLVHWQHVVDLLDSPLDWAFGKGLGRFPERLFLAAPNTDFQTGDIRLVESAGRRHVVMTGGKHEIDWGQLFRLSQRVAAPQGATVATVEVLAERATGLHLEVCEKHLLYNARCLFAGIQVPAAPGQWQRLEVPLPGDPIGGGSAGALRLVTFSAGVTTRGGRLEVDNLALRGADGRDLLVNGGFDRGLARWYVSSDHHHMPWHEKSVVFYLLFGQGLVGLGLAALLVAGAFWRLAAGSARDHPLAPPLAGALVAFLGVGLIDSLLDAPRIAWLFYLLLLVALTLPKAFPGRSVATSA